MRFILTLKGHKSSYSFEFDFKYHFSSAMHKLFRKADSFFSNFPTDNYSTYNQPQVRLFTFSDLHFSHPQQNDEFSKTEVSALITMCLYVPIYKEQSIINMLKKQKFAVGDNTGRAVFTIESVERIADFVPEESAGLHSLKLNVLSPVVAGQKNARGYYDYYSPTQIFFGESLRQEWVKKYKVVAKPSSELLFKVEQQTRVNIVPSSNLPDKKILVFKNGFQNEFKVRGYTKFYLTITSTSDMLKLALDSGLGLYNTLGCGCVKDC